ncbi:MAG: bifunctional (p)ppGpp synthetase/guanosine-3',5'-bis(diphosphate) 3'-pyrophosphohydrolase [Sutterellaceae bacterium]|nr:bifunctional (p)ppGpp synthetase/guanosine-3',5'-bis(diphosphate) 3'-pyrophosphohydrolase [Burkholderiaceae bacterium]MDW8430456.1 bifunctional (p)ppGpp synthetase/guanosine-3',5'-bis(diphosphate) 3'-pyrophosphohydrolase [Sutterellaceae bacterium]
MAASNPAPSDVTPGYSPGGLARRAAEALRRAGKAVWRGDAQAEEPRSPAVVSFAALTERLKGYLSHADLQKVKEAYRFSDAAHLGQFRKSGEPYITHPIAVAETLAEWKLDAAAIQAALLHDVLEDSGISKQELAAKFGPVVAELVDGVSKLDRLRFDSTEQQQAESFRKMLLAMARDVRVILIKLADRLHNVRTLDAMEPEKRRRIARETLEIYAPIAHRLGLNALYRELQEQSFARLHPLRYRTLQKAVLAARGNRREVLGKIYETVRKGLANAKIKAEIQGREKTIYGIYRKMVEKHLSFSEVLDIYGLRVVVPTRSDCYLALGVLHSLFKPVPGRFKDYIAIPKVNGYQSLHTTVIGPYGMPVEFQIRTPEMHHVAESGVAAHWLYKEDDTSLSELQSRTHQWLQSLLEIQSQSGDSAELMENIKVDLFPDKVYVFTPKGKIVSLPRAATAVDFAYSIHTDVGNRCVAARINGEVQPLRTELRNGDVVEIITGPVARPNPSWLSFVRTGRARAEIRHFLRRMKREESIALGESLLSQAARQLGIALAEIPPERWDALVREAQAKDREEILADIGLGRRLAAVVARQLALGVLPPDGSALARSAAPVIIRGTEGMALQMANCCTPIPGDDIVGHMRKDQGLAVHQTDCPYAQRARRADPERWVDLQWADEIAGSYAVNLNVSAANERGVLGRIAVALAEADSNILSVHLEDDNAEQALIHFKLQVKDRQHLARLIRTLRRIKQVSRVTRVRAGRASGEDADARV